MGSLFRNPNFVQVAGGGGLGQIATEFLKPVEATTVACVRSGRCMYYPALVSEVQSSRNVSIACGSHEKATNKLR